MPKLSQNINHQPSQKVRQTKTGFTLVEVLVVSAILGVLSVLSYPFYSRLVLQNAVSDTADKLVSSLRKAESYALASKDGSNWGVQFSGGNIFLLRESSGTVFDTYNVSSNISVSGLDHIIFTKPAGLPNSTGTFTVSGGSNTKSITLNSEGVASVSD